MSLSEDVSWLIGRRDGNESNRFSSYMLPNKMTINPDMLCPFMINVIVCNLNSTLIITADGGRKTLSDSHVG